mgnify:CR=1 FL=1
MKKIFSLILTTLLVMSAACSTDDDHDHDNGNSYEMSVTINVFDWVLQSNLEGVDLCWGDEVGCAKTDSKGNATGKATVTPGAVLTLRGDKEGYFPFLTVVEAPAQATSSVSAGWAMANSAIIDQLVGSLGEPIDDTKGQATVLVNGPADANGQRSGLEGATVSISSKFGQGPKYFMPTAEFANGKIFSEGESMTAGGLAALFNVDVGEATVTVTADGHTCNASQSGVRVGDNSSTSPIEAGRVTYFSFFCEKN